MGISHYLFPDMYRAAYRLHRGGLLPKNRVQQLAAQENVLKELHAVLPMVSYGKEHNADEIDALPIVSYEEIYPWIDRAWQGEENVLWHGKMDWFAKSSGTTNARSKYIPVSRDGMQENHFLAGRDMLACYLSNNPESKLGFDSIVTITGSIQEISQSGAKAADVSTVLSSNMPWWTDLVKILPKEIVEIPSWQERFPKAVEFLKTSDVRAFVGTVTWLHLLMDEAVKQSGKKNALELWPDMEVFFHGAVSIKPYLPDFARLVPSNNFKYVEVYNASEGFFAFQDTLDRNNGMLLLCAHGIYYEFRDLKTGHIYNLDSVEKNCRYEMIISTVSGLWRYTIGDVVEIMETDPVRVRIVGRTKAMLNAYGEELMIDNVDEAIAFLNTEMGYDIREYTGCPIYKDKHTNGGHEWIIGFETIPEDMSKFVDSFDSKLRTLNSDYDAKRKGDIVLCSPHVHPVTVGVFHEWMQKRGKSGGQNKIPRLSESREHVESILEMIGK